jgi:hypothetical protein
MSFDRSIFMLRNTAAMRYANFMALRHACEMCHTGRYYEPTERASLFAAPAYGEVVWC